MKTKLCLLILLLASAWARAQTNDLTVLLQQGLFEEQGNRNLDAAIADYQSLTRQFDKNRQVAATAIFRLGECYRALGQTNEAAAQYQRILKDFSDQQMLATLSQQDLAGMGIESFKAGKVAEQSNGNLTEARSLAAQISGIEQLKSVQEKSLAVQAIFPDETLKKMLLQLPKLQTQANMLKNNPQLTYNQLTQTQGYALAVGDFTVSEMHSTNLLADAEWELKKQNTAIEQRVDFILEIQKARLKVLQSTSGVEVAEGNFQNEAAPVTTDDESQEIIRIQQMIQNSPDLINAPDSGGSTPLEKAASAGWLKVAAFLLDHGADVNAVGRTALNDAASVGNRAMVEFLLSRGANVNSKSLGTEDTPLHTAARRGFQAVVKVLLANKADLNAQNKGGWSPLMCAASANHPEIVKLLLATGANPNLKGSDGGTALNCAIGNSPEIFQALLAAGINPNTENSQGRTPLSYAVEKDSAKVVKLLLDAKANPNGDKLDAPLLCAINKNDVASAKLLLQAGANPNVNGNVNWLVSVNGRFYSNHDFTPLFLAVSLKQFSMVQLLLKYKADANDSQFNGRPLLFSAMSDTNILEALLDAGAKVDARDPTAKAGDNKILNWTPLMAAVNDNLSADTVGILLQHGANPNLRDEVYGQTPLHWSAGWGDNQLPNRKVLELLLDDKADPNVRNTSGKTPLDLFKAQLVVANISAEQKTAIAALANLLRQHGALDKLPDWDAITMSRPAADFSFALFHKGTNDWNQFTLLEAIENLYTSSQPYSVPRGNNTWAGYSLNSMLPFPDLSRVVILRPSHDSTNETRIVVNLLNDTNGIDCTKDVPLQFGDVVEIPEREHALGENAVGLTSGQSDTLDNYVKGSAQLIVHGQKVELPFYRLGSQATLKVLLDQPASQRILLSSSDLAHVKVIRRDPKTGKSREWILNCDLPESSANAPGVVVAHPLHALSYQWYIGANNSSPSSDLWLRDGDVIEVPEKQ